LVEVELTSGGAVLTITLNRPEVLNAFDDAMHAGLRAALEEARDDLVRAVVITGAGRGFCVGQDVSAFTSRADLGDLLRRTYHPNILALRGLNKPVIAAVNGAAAGAGLSLAMACDVRIASRAAVFVPAFINIGLVPDSGGSHFLTRILGPARALEWMSSGRRLNAEEALAWGLVSELVEAEALEARAAELAAALASLPTAAIGLHKRLFDAAPLHTLEEQLELEAGLQAAAAATADFAEGVAAFRERRPPSFRGA
jgi:2-(1,2-epoxy-1,2-dihydrophenyl)acetyl-CoA isomerase